MEQQRTEVLVVGAGVGGTAAALQAARRGAEVLLVSEGPWLGGMLTSAGVAVPDGNELAAFRTGIWGQFVRSLQAQQPGGLDQSWVSCFCYEPKVGAQVFADWVAALPNLTWISGQKAIAVERAGQQITAVQFPDYRIEAQIIIDGTELGDVIALGNVPHRWGWEAKELWNEPSAPPQAELEADPFFERYPVQSPTWVVILQDFGPDAKAPLIPEPEFDAEATFAKAWERFGAEKFLDYGRLPGDRFMLNWPIHGNDYGFGLDRLLSQPLDWEAWAKEAIAYSQGFAHYIQKKMGRRYGLATDTFPSQAIGGGAYGLHPYYRESRRIKGLATVVEQDILPQPEGLVAALPRNEQGQVTSIAIGNYPNDHHYPEREIPLAPKARRWGGRWTGTPFTIPYGALVPESVDGLLACEKNISVSHMANGATRLQPTVLGIGQAAGMAAALCVELGCEARSLPVRKLQEALLNDSQAPLAVVPLYNLTPDHPDWNQLQKHYLEHPEQYPSDGEHPSLDLAKLPSPQAMPFEHAGVIVQADERGYRIEHPKFKQGEVEGLPLITLRPEVEVVMRELVVGQRVAIAGYLNPSGPWVRLAQLQYLE